MAAASTLVPEKLGQAVEILGEQDVDLWLTLVRETLLTRDPCLDLVADVYCAWHGAFLVSRTGERIAIVGRYDAPSVEQLGVYDVVGYDESFSPALRKAVEGLAPRSIALNYSESDPAADGLTHGLWLNLQEALAGTPYVDRLGSSEAIVNALRGRKSPEEVRRIRGAVQATEEIFERVAAELEPGQSELDIASLVHADVAAHCLGYAWEREHCPAVNAGPEKEVGHSAPGELRTSRGELLHMDFGVSRDDYCSDLQRVWYLLADGEETPPEDVTRAWQALWDSVDAGVAKLPTGRDRLGGRRGGAGEPRCLRLSRAEVRAGPPARAGPRTTAGRCSGRAGIATGRRRSGASRRGTSSPSSWDRRPRPRLHRPGGRRANHRRRRRVAQHAAARALARPLTSTPRRGVRHRRRDGASRPARRGTSCARSRPKRSRTVR